MTASNIKWPINIAGIATETQSAKEAKDHMILMRKAPRLLLKA